MKQRLMILGAGPLQLPGILRAKAMGLHVIAIDMNKNAIGIQYADEFYEISTTDIEPIVKKAEQLRIDGIMTLATDRPMRAVAMAGERLGLRTISYETAIRATDKARMREQLARHGVPIPLFSIAWTYREFEQIAYSLQGDLVVKPADSSGSRGIHLLRYRSELRRVFEYSKASSSSGEIVVEEYMEGPEVSVETITLAGMTHVVAITDKLTSGPPHFVEKGHSVQSLLPDDAKSDIAEVAKKAIAAIGIDDGPAHTEIILTKEGPKVVELGARLGGDYITTSLVPLATGIDMVQACIDLAIGNNPDINPKFDRGSAIRYLDSYDGILCGIKGVEKARNIEGMHEIKILKSVGDELKEITNSADRVGYVIAHADSTQKAIDVCDQALAQVNIMIGKG